MAVNRTGSILAADFGSIYTRVVLIDIVDGVYRLVGQGESRTTADFPVSDVSVGLDRALVDLAEVSKRRLMNDNGRLIIPEKPDRSGVDHFVATASLGRPLQTVLVGLVPDLSVASGLRAACGTYINVAEVVSLDDGRSEEERLNAIFLARPDLVFITGGTDKGAQDAVLQLSEVVRLAVTLIDQKHKPLIVYAGNRMLHAQIQKLFEDVATVLIADNVRPGLDDEILDSAQLQLGHAFDEFKERHGEGFRVIGDQSRVGVLATAQSYTWVTEYLGKIRPRENIIAIDVGSAVGIAAAAVEGEVTTSIRTDIGLGQSAYAMLQGVGFESIRRWLPFHTTPAEVVNYALNKTVRPAGIPANLRELYLEHALLRAGISQMVGGMRMAEQDTNYDMIIGAGSGLTRTGNKGYTAMLLLDALQPTGVTALYADWFGLIPAFGAMALITPEAVVQMLEGGDLERLGTSICVSGEIKPGKPALHAKIIVEGEAFDLDVEGGHISVLPLPAGRHIEVQLRVSGRGVHIGGKQQLKLTVEGGTAGLIFDLRGRPLPLALEPAGRAAQIPLWISQATGDELIPIDERWLMEAATDMEGSVARKGDIVKAAKPQKERRGWFGRGGKAKPAAQPAKSKAAEAADDDAFMALLDEQTEEEDEFASLRNELRQK